MHAAIATYAAELATFKLTALRRLHDIMLRTESDAEARRCAIAILRAPNLEDPCQQNSPSQREGAGGWVRSTPDSQPSPPSSPTSKSNTNANPAELPNNNATPDSPKSPSPNHTHLLQALTRDPTPASLLRARAGAAPPYTHQHTIISRLTASPPRPTIPHE